MMGSTVFVVHANEDLYEILQMGKFWSILKFFHLPLNVRSPDPTQDDMALSTTELLSVQWGDIKMSSTIFGSQVTKTGVIPIQVIPVFPYLWKNVVREPILPVDTFSYKFH